MNIRRVAYRILVEKHPQIRRQYQLRANQGKIRGNMSKALALADLHMRRLTGRLVPKPKVCMCESGLYPKQNPCELAEQLVKYDVISFDVFDTLLFRPFSNPTELFHLVGEQLGYMNFADLRERMECEARKEMQRRCGTTEVTLREIYQHIEKHCGIPADLGLEMEMKTERDLLQPNPYMAEVLQLIPRDKATIAISDTYFSNEFLTEILRGCNMDRFEQVLASCAYRKGKGNGELFDEAKKLYAADANWIHVGDNWHSDVAAPRKLDIQAIHYPNINALGNKHRAAKQSAIVGGAYRGIVNAQFHNGLEAYSPFYEYGYFAGGIFVLGYCTFLHRYVREKGIERLVFLSRDGDILKRAYDMLYPESDTRYVYWSRLAAAKLGAKYFKYDYFRRFLKHNISQGMKIGQILHAMDLDEMAMHISQSAKLSLDDTLTAKNESALEQAMYANWDKILTAYRTQTDAAKQYFTDALSGCGQAGMVDIGWTGSGGIILAQLIRTEWNIPCEIYNIIAGTNTPFCEEPDAAESLLASGKVKAYLFSQSLNRDIWSVHNPSKGHNLWMELLLSSTDPGFVGYQYCSDQVSLCFDENPDPNNVRIEEIHRGILDFIEKYAECFAEYPYMMDISGSDAYRPFAAAAGSNTYMKELTSNHFFVEGIVHCEKG